MKYSEAIKTPKGGAVNMTFLHLQAQAANCIPAINSEFLYNWANKFDIDLTINGHIMTKYENLRAVIDDVCNSKFDRTKTLIIFK